MGTIIRYNKTTQKDVNQFMNPKAASTAKESEDLAIARGETNANGTQVEDGIYPIINPVQTMLGPIGEFIVEPENFPVHCSMGLFGKRRTGKSFSLRWIMYNAFKDTPFGIVLTRTDLNGFWQAYIPSKYVFHGLQMHQMQNLIKRQTMLVQKWKKEHPKETAENPDSYKRAPELAAFCILDDVIADRVEMQW